MTPKHQRPDRRPWLVVAALGKGVGMKHAAKGLRAAVVTLHNGGSPRVEKAFLVGRDDTFPFCVDRNEVSICAQALPIRIGAVCSSEGGSTS
jgi:hypothetical protein